MCTGRVAASVGAKRLRRPHALGVDEACAGVQLDEVVVRIAAGSQASVMGVRGAAVAGAANP